MKENSLRERLEKLRSEINFHNYHYHVLDEPIISDVEFDRMLQELREIESQHPEWVDPSSPTQRTGAAPSERFAKVRHPGPILSLANAFNNDGVRAWFDRICRIDDRVERANFVVEPKIDGLTVVLHYRDGYFVQGATRGDGEIGEDITNNLRTIKAVPLQIPIKSESASPPSYIAIRGEAFITLSDFDSLNQRLVDAGEKPYQNPRNTAAGSLRQLDPALTAARPLTLLTYAIVTADGPVPGTQWETLQYLREMGFPVSDSVKLCPDITSAIAACEQGIELRQHLQFEVDGMVIKINDLALQAGLGVVGKDPRGAIAYKFPALEVTTTLKEIGINVGRTGVLTPFAVLDPVEIGGVTVGKATLHNFDYITEKDIRVGDRILLKRAGDVIPYVIGPVAAARDGTEEPFRPPEKCPACGQMVEKLPGEVAYYCVNSSCPAQLIRNVEHFVSRSAMDIVGMGIKIVEQLIAENIIKDVADLYKLTREDLLQLEGFAEKKADNLIRAIQTTKSQSLARLINALGIRGVGEVMAADLASKFPDLQALSNASIIDLQNIEGVGPNIAESIVDWFARPANQNVLSKLRESGVWPTRPFSEQTTTTEKAIFSGLTFVITGTLPSWSRDQAKQFILENGGKVTSSVSKSTDYLVLGENAGSKLDKAKELGINIIDETALREMAK